MNRAASNGVMGKASQAGSPLVFRFVRLRRRTAGFLGDFQ
jgi:hypothetical protein